MIIFLANGDHIQGTGFHVGGGFHMAAPFTILYLRKCYEEASYARIRPKARMRKRKLVHAGMIRMVSRVMRAGPPRNER
jgi:hypothetical protein